MEYCEDILVLGDVHGDFRALGNLVNKKHPKIVLQCGDFGYWPAFKVRNRRGVLKESRPRIGETKLCWCDGNHEDFSSLRAQETSETYDLLIT
jgi:predicted phosphodiesterase